MTRFSTAGVSASSGIFDVDAATTGAVFEQDLDARLDVLHKAQQEHEEDDHDDQNDGTHADGDLPERVRVKCRDGVHLPTATFLSARASR